LNENYKNKDIKDERENKENIQELRHNIAELTADLKKMKETILNQSLS